MVHVVYKARESELYLLMLPLFYSHDMQSSDVSFSKPFKSTIGIYKDVWTIQNRRNRAQKDNLASWVLKALRRAHTMQNIFLSFRAYSSTHSTAQPLIQRFHLLQPLVADSKEG
jgi:hypothetical protein